MLEFTLSEDKTYYIVTGCDKKAPSAIIPAEYNGLPVDEIDKKAFSYCEYLKSLTILKNVRILDRYTFHHCKYLNEVIIGNEVTSFCFQAFHACFELKKVNFLGTIDEWAERNLAQAFEYEYDLYINDVLVTDVTLDTAKISEYAFFNCRSLKNVTLSDNVEVLGRRAFENCYNLVDVSFQDSLTDIGFDAFNGCIKLNYTKYNNAYYLGPDNNKYKILIKAVNKDINSCVINSATEIIAISAFDKCKSLESVTVEEDSKLVSIGRCAFSDCVNLKNVNFDSVDQLADISVFAFDSCGFNSFSIPDGVKTVDETAFYRCDKLSNLKIPSSLQVIEAGTFNWSFGACPLQEVEFINYIGWQVEIPNEYGDIKIKKISKRHLMNAVKSAKLLTHYSNVKWVNTLDLSKMKKF